MKKSPIGVQEWVESIPPPSNHSNCTPVRRFLPREMSLQSDDSSSHCSSLESVLEQRKPDPEAVLIGLGFGPSKDSNMLSRIPERFLQPSKVLPQIDLDRFLAQYGQTRRGSTSTPPSPAKSRPQQLCRDVGSDIPLN